jgi:outer membrane receptor protein involved in Fe transport
MASTNRARLMNGAVLFAVALTLSAHAHAENADSATAAPVGPGELTEVIVTAQKRKQSAQSIGLAVSVLGADALASLGRQDVTAMVKRLPNVQVQQYSPSSTVSNIRGVSQHDFADSQETPIAFYNDEVYISALGQSARADGIEPLSLGTDEGIANGSSQWTLGNVARQLPRPGDASTGGTSRAARCTTIVSAGNSTANGIGRGTA